ncbi:LTA synthase family protein [Burkholderia sp. NRF60-BP8]|uniref:LTA synthase family protein n=1 Tax=Burkholderia sp. NRF60-BP8 TaxID=1637853 RepID=UPI000756ECCE|nr:LTA synthase family protein [Burkholderia sp. NRF60-BP8]AOI77810.1 capsular biosynthesis protein [Burkholderia sp. NRF60-BP8]KVA17837.1 capsular biosynthesis protein [Burkholderia sp. NRF60-BP8]
MNGELATHGLAVAAALVLSFGLDLIARPRGAWHRPLAAVLLHAFAVVCVFCVVFSLTIRPLFSAFVSVALVGLLAAVNNAKYESLLEPFVFTDLSLFSQLFSHPRLYLPFLSGGKVVAIATGVILLMSGYVLERPLFPSFRGVAMLGAAMCFLCARWFAADLELSLVAADDRRRFGFFAVFAAYLLNGLRISTVREFERQMGVGVFVSGAPAKCPDVVVIQSESFFDVRRVGPAINRDILSRFDRACQEATVYGELTVPAWGANTMRTEFSVLTGLSFERLGYARFYPYAFVRRACASIASWFGRGGYETLALHPYYADFFGRNRVFPLLGFNTFLDIEYFADAPRAGPYISDAAVLDAVITALESEREKPRFIFAMTMENHGPLHLEQVLPGESSSRHTLGEGASWRDLTAYLRHIENADAMIGRLLDHLRASDRETVVCFYGDHVPALPHVFEKLGVSPQTSDYFIWRNYGTDTPECRDLAAEELGVALLHVVQDDGNRAEEPHASEKAT